MCKVRWFVAALLAGSLLGLAVRSGRLEPIATIPDAKEFLARVAAKYATCESYQDEGSVDTSIEARGGDRSSQTSSFSTAFLRSGQIRFDYSRGFRGDKTCIVWRDRGSVKTWMGPRQEIADEPTLGHAMDDTAVISEGTAERIPALLLPEEIPGLSLSMTLGEWSIEEADMISLAYYTLHGCIDNSTITLTIDKESLLVVQVDYVTDTPSQHLKRSIHYSPVMDGAIADTSLVFAPPVNESCIKLAGIFNPEPVTKSGSRSSGDIDLGHVLKPSTEKKLEADSESDFSVRGIRLQGGPEFQACVQQALQVLSDRDPESCSLVTRFIDRIQENGPHGIWPLDREPFLGLPRESACYSPAFCAALLVYYAQQSKLYYEYKDQSGLPVPEVVWMGNTPTEICSERAMQALKAIGGPEFQIAYLMQNDILLKPTKP